MDRCRGYGKRSRIWQDKLHAAVVPTRRQPRLFRLTPKQNVPIPFNTHITIVLPNPKRGLVHSISKVTGRGFDGWTLLRTLGVGGRQG